jgi:helicase
MIAMSEPREDSETAGLRENLKTLGNRYSLEILEVLCPKTGDVVPALGWDAIVEGILTLMGVSKPLHSPDDERTNDYAKYEKLRRRFASGGTLYESMNKLIQAGFVQPAGGKGKRQRRFTATHEGRIALQAVRGMRGPASTDTEVQRAAKLLLKHKNFVRLLPAQEKFLREIDRIDDNLIIQMPPGSGKTFLGIIAILTSVERKVKCLYVSPYMSLNRQILDEYGALLHDLGLSVVRHDGQVRGIDEDLERADLVVSVYESAFLAILQRKPWTQSIGLVVVDEATELDSQELGSDRSARLDCLITLFKRQAKVLTLSSRFGGTDNVAKWLKARVFRPSVTLIPDEFIVTSGIGTVNIRSSDGTADYQASGDDVIGAVLEHIGSNQNKALLIVTGSRSRTESVAEYVASRHLQSVNSALVDQIVSPSDDMPAAQRLRKTLQAGVAFHHAGLDSALLGRLEKAIKSGDIKTVVSTTGITAGISFPFDCIVILYDNSMGYVNSRSRYLQIAGRIGEYHLAEYGGRVYLVLETPTQQYETPREVEEALLRQPHAPLCSSAFYPSLTVSLVMREARAKQRFGQEELETDFLRLVNETLRASMRADYLSNMKNQFAILFEWLVREELIAKIAELYTLTSNAREAFEAGLDPIDYVGVRKILAELTDSPDMSTLVELLLRFNLVQSSRPRTVVPSEIEIQMAGVEKPLSWSSELAEKRKGVKKQALTMWLEEKSIAHILETSDKLGEHVVVGTRRIAGSNLDEEDLATLAESCSSMAESISKFMAATGRDVLKARFALLSKQLRFGVKEDLAGSNLMELQVIRNGNQSPIALSRAEARILYDRGYRRIAEVVYTDADANKPGLARNRFAVNSGLEPSLAKDIYKAAIIFLRTRKREER